MYIAPYQPHGAYADFVVVEPIVQLLSLMAPSSIELDHAGVLQLLARFDVRDVRDLRNGTVPQRGRDVMRPAIARDQMRPASPGQDLRKHSHDAMRCQLEVHLHVLGLALQGVKSSITLTSRMPSPFSRCT